MTKIYDPHYKWITSFVNISIEITVGRRYMIYASASNINSPQYPACWVKTVEIYMSCPQTTMKYFVYRPQTEIRYMFETEQQVNDRRQYIKTHSTSLREVNQDNQTRMIDLNLMCNS